MAYRPVFLAAVEARYASSSLNVDETRNLQVVVPLEDGPIPFGLDRAEVVDLPSTSLEADPRPGISFRGRLPADASQPKSYDGWGRDVARWIKGEQPITLFESTRFKEVSRPGESERDFRMRLADLGREARDEQADKLRRKYEPKLDRLAGSTPPCRAGGGEEEGPVAAGACSAPGWLPLAACSVPSLAGASAANWAGPVPPRAVRVGWPRPDRTLPTPAKRSRRCRCSSPTSNGSSRRNSARWRTEAEARSPWKRSRSGPT